MARVRAGRGSDSYKQRDGKYQTILSRGGLDPGAGDAAWGGDLLGAVTGLPGLHTQCALDPSNTHVLILG